MSHNNKYQTLTPEQFEEWKTHEVTEVFFQFLNDFMNEKAKEKIPNGAPQTMDDMVAMGVGVAVVNATVEVIDDIVNIRHVDIKDFYNPPSEKQEPKPDE